MTLNDIVRMYASGSLVAADILGIFRKELALLLQ